MYRSSPYVLDSNNRVIPDFRVSRHENRYDFVTTSRTISRLPTDHLSSTMAHGNTKHLAYVNLQTYSAPPVTDFRHLPHTDFYTRGFHQVMDLGAEAYCRDRLSFNMHHYNMQLKIAFETEIRSIQVPSTAPNPHSPRTCSRAARRGSRGWHLAACTRLCRE